MNFEKTISFIQNKRPKYKDPYLVKGIPQPVPDKGYVDEKGRQGNWVKNLVDLARIESTYVNDRLLEKTITFFNEKNNPTIKEIYKGYDLDLVKTMNYDRDGNLYYEDEYKNNKLNGDAIYYDKNGSINRVEKWKNDVRLTTVYYNPDGSVKHIEDWINK